MGYIFELCNCQQNALDYGGAVYRSNYRGTYLAEPWRSQNSLCKSFHFATVTSIKTGSSLRGFLRPIIASNLSLFASNFGFHLFAFCTSLEYTVAYSVNSIMARDVRPRRPCAKSSAIPALVPQFSPLRRALTNCVPGLVQYPLRLPLDLRSRCACCAGQSHTRSD